MASPRHLQDLGFAADVPGGLGCLGGGAFGLLRWNLGRRLQQHGAAGGCMEKPLYDYK